MCMGHGKYLGFANLAQSLTKLGRRDEAIREYRRALTIKPRFGLAWLGLGQVLEEMGRETEAEDCYRKALANRIHTARELATLARFCQRHGWFEAAATNFDDAIKLNPSDAILYVEAGQNFSALGRHAEAEQHYAEAEKLSPDLMQAHFLYGVEFGREGKLADAAEQFREAVRIMPDLVEARLNLGMALMRGEIIPARLRNLKKCFSGSNKCNGASICADIARKTFSRTIAPILNARFSQAACANWP